MNNLPIIHIIGEDTGFYERLKQLIKEQYTLTVYPSLTTFRQSIFEKSARFVLLDSTVTGAADAVRWLKHRDPQPTVIGYAATTPVQIEHLLEAGADDVFQQDTLLTLIKRRLESHLTTFKDTSYRTVFETANDAIMIVDMQTEVILAANQRAVQWLGYSLDDLMTMRHSDLVVQNPYARTAPDVVQTLNTKGYVIFEDTYRTSDGRKLPVEISSRMITYQGQRAALNFLRDIRQRQQMRAAELEQRRLTEALRDIAATLNSTLHQDEVVRRILAQVARVVESDAANVMLIEGDYVRVIGYHGYNHELSIPPEAMNPGLKIKSIANFQEIVQTRQPMIIPDISQYPEWVKTPGSEWVNSHLGAPIIVGDEVIGIMNLDDSRVGHFSSRDAERLMAFSDQVSIAIRNARLYAQVQRQNADLETRIEQRTSALVETNAKLQLQIIENQRIEAELMMEQALLRTVMDNIPDEVYVKDLEGRFVLVNHALESRLYNSQPDIDLLGSTDFDHSPPALAAAWQAQELEMYQTGKMIENIETRVYEDDGEATILMITKMPLRDSEGTIIGLVGINRDITEMRRTDAALREERRLLRTVIDNIPDDVYAKDREGRFILVNKPLEDRLKGYLLDGQPVIGTTSRAYMPPARAAKREEDERPIIEAGISQINKEVEMIYRDGTRHYHLATKVPLRDEDGDIMGLVAINRDITSVKEAEDRLHHVLRGVNCLLWHATVEDDINDDAAWMEHLYISNVESAQQFLPLKVAPNETYAGAWQRSILAADQTGHRKQLQRVMRAGVSRYQGEFRCHRADGQVRWLQDDVQIRLLANNRWSLVGVCTDITDRKLAETAMQHTNELLEYRVSERTRALSAMNIAERAQRELAEALRDTAAALSSSLDLNEVLDRILTSAARVMPQHDTANILLIEDTEFVRLIRAREYAQQTARFKTLVDTPRFYLPRVRDFQNILETQRPVIISKASQTSNWIQYSYDKVIQSYIVAPIKSEGQVIGFVSLGSTEQHRFGQSDADKLIAFTNQAGIAIQNARLYDAVRQHATDLSHKVAERTAELEAERGQLQAILNAMTEGVIYYDVAHQVQYTNQSLVTLTGYTQEEWQRADDRLLCVDMPEADYDLLLRDMLKILREQGMWKHEMEMQRKDGTHFEAALIATRVMSEEQVIGTVMVMRDISQEKYLDKMKSRFIANASHELRTPLTNMNTRLYLIGRQPEKTDVHLAVMREVTTRMRELVNNLLDVSRLEQGMIQLEREIVPVQDIIQAVVRVQQPEAENKQIALSAEVEDDPVYVSVDHARMLQVLTNLVTNAINYTDSSGSIEVTMSRNPQHVTLHITDTGHGIPDDLMPNVFKPFVRGAETAKGSGLGLSISKEIVELHGGEISVESQVGVGTRFSVQLVIAEQAANTS